MSRRDTPLMIRFPPYAAALVAAGVLAGIPTPAAAQDKVTYHDRAAKKDLEAGGAILSESPAKIVLRSTTGAATKELAAADVLDVVYDVPPGIRLDYRGAIGDERKIEIAKEEERKKAIEDAIGSYQKLVRGMTGDRGKLAARHLSYKIARLKVRQAEDDPAAAGEAISALTKFRKEHPDGWQLVHACRLLARLQTDQGDHAGAQKTWEELAATPGVAKETKQEADLGAARALARGKHFAEAEKRLQDVLKGVSPDDPQATRARIYLAECLGVSNKLDEAVRQLEDLIAKTPDPLLKAVAYNTLGDCYRYHNRSKDALWPYLWVDVVYHQDRREHQRAVGQLSKLFDELGDKARAKQYQDKLRPGIR
jgi:tetratricopeptide (TPR) repeat protein